MRIDRLTVLTFVIIPLIFALLLFRIITSGDAMVTARTVNTFQTFLLRNLSILFVGVFLLLLLLLLEDRLEYGVIMTLHWFHLIPRVVPPEAYTAIRDEALDRIEATRVLSHHLRLSALGPTDHPLRALEFWLARLFSHDPFIKIPERFVEVSEHFRLLEEDEVNDWELRETYADISLSVLGRTLSIMGRQLAMDIAYEGMMLAIILGALFMGYSVLVNEPLFCIGCTEAEAEAAAALHLGGIVPMLNVGILMLIMGLVYQFYAIVNGVEIPLLRLRILDAFPDHAVVLADVERRILEGEAHGERGWVLREYLKLAYQFLYEALIAWWEGKENEAAAYAYACDELCREIKAMHADFESHAELLSREHRVVHYGEESAWF